MAKQIVGPLERHVEKAVVGAAGLVLLGVIAMYLVGSPNKVDLDGAGDPVTPGTIDAKVAEKAAAVREMIRRAQPKVEVPDPLADDFLAQLDPFKGSDLASPLKIAVAVAPTAPIIDAPTVIEGDARLVEVLPLPRPAVTSGRSTFLVPSGNDTVYVPENWATLSTTFDRKSQMQRQALSYGETRNEVIFGPVEVQRRAQRPDGTWSDDDWNTIECKPAEPIPKVPEINLVTENKQLVVPKEDYSEVVRFYDNLKEPLKQLGILRPLMYPTANGTPWSFPLLSTYRDVQQQDDEYVNPSGPGPELPDRYGLRTETVEAEAGPKLTPAEQSFQEGQKLLDVAASPADCLLAYNKFADVEQLVGSTPSLIANAKKKMAEAEQKQRDIERKIRIGENTPIEVAGSTPARQLSPVQQIWAHDSASGSLIPGNVYQYRMRAQLYNRLAGEPLLFRNKEDAKVVFVRGEWSEPSNPVHVPYIERFFVTGADDRKEEATVEFFRWYYGVWVKTRQKFGIGSKLVFEDRVDAPSLDDPLQPDRPLVNFAANAVVMDVNSKRNFREQKRGTGRSGVKYAAASPSQSVVLVDDAGNLHERFVPMDKTHPEKNAISPWTPPRKTN